MSDIRQDIQFNSHRFLFANLTFDQFKEDHIHWNSTDKIEYSVTTQLIVDNLEINQGHFTYQGPLQTKYLLSIIQQENQIILFCSCQLTDDKLCRHQAQLLFNILKRVELKIFFSSRLRQQKLKQYAADYGLEKEEVLDLFFSTRFENGQVIITPKQKGLIPVNRDILQNLTQEITAADQRESNTIVNILRPTLLVFREHKYYQHLMLDLYYASRSKEGKPKNPFTPIDPMECLWHYSEANELKYLISVAQFQKRADHILLPSDLVALKTIIRNAFNCEVYVHNSNISENTSATTITPVFLNILPDTIQITVIRQQFFYEISGQITIDQNEYALSDLSLKFGCFIQIKETLYLVNNLTVLRLIDFLKKSPDNLLVHLSKFAEFKTQFLDKIESRVSINYDYISQATPIQMAEYGFDQDIESIIYLSDLGEFVKITPVVRYSDVEINIRTKRAIYGMDEEGKEFLVDRDKNLELSIIALLVKQHTYFEEQLDNELEYFYLHRKHFLNEDWFLSAFSIWREKGITILGFNSLSGNKLNPYPAKVSVKVVSGINWFNSKIRVQFGKRKASLKKIQLAVRNKSKYVQLDDGTLGILPEEWLNKFTGYFNAGEISDEEILKTARINFSAIEQLYDPEMLEETTRLDLMKYRQQFNNFENIQPVKIHPEFVGVLRPYQQQGLNWLNFLDDFNFGGCLADDMGLGKTVQIIAFILSQREKVKKNVNLIVAPTSVIFNWKQELEKFAPSIHVLTIGGVYRKRDPKDFDQYEVILISYTLLLSDVNYLKKFTFNYIFLDESQNIKNPDTQRFRAAMLLKSRNKMTITGTPIENNTFDIFSQFSFCCPGLLGNQRYFRAIYSIPIDKFKNSVRAIELRKKIQPFILRRTKGQVASDLPEKTEMVLYCELKPEQRKIYDAYEKEFRDYISATGNDELKKSSMHVLRGLTKLRQICNSPKLIDEEAPGESTSAKIDILLEQIEEHASRHKLLVFSQFVGMLDLIKSALDQRNVQYVSLTGSTRNRQELVEKFQEDPEVRVFLISLKAGGTGLNLTQADYVYLIDPWWNPAVENQAIDRSHRIGQKQNVTAVRLISPDTIEEKIIKLQEHKQKLTDSLISEESGFFQSLTKEDLLSLL